MDIPQTKLKLLVSGEQSGVRWNALPLLIDAMWDAGSDAEKFAVLAAMRNAYPETCNSDMRDIETRTPSEVGRGEGFTLLSYVRALFLDPCTVIVPARITYLNFVPRSDFSSEARRHQLSTASTGA